MAVTYGPSKILAQGLLVDLDAYTTTSYPGSGSTWYDLSGNGNNATLSNTPTYSSGALTFNGTNQYGDIASIAGTTGMTAFTTSTFAKITGSNAGATTTLFSLDFIITGTKVSNNSVYGQASLVTIGNIATETVFTATYGNWYHFVVSWSSGSTLKLYVNGTLWDATNSTYTGTLNNPSGATIANYSGNYAPCTLSKIGLWNVELTPSQISAYYNAYKGRYSL